MSTICKLDPEVRRRRTMRRNLLRNPPRIKNGERGAILMAELALIVQASYLTGDEKHRLFERGATQLTQT